MVDRRGTAWVGCSGWSYREWRGPFYAEDRPARTWFEQYAQHFRTVELNATFYRLPPTSTVDLWARQAPEGFAYAAKVGRFATHQKRLADPERWLPRHLERIERLGPALGPNLMQLPPRWHRDVDRLDEALAAAPRTLRWAVELRDRSWLHDEVLEVLARHDAALCVHDLLDAHPWTRTASWAYVRFHGPEATRRPYHGRYGGRRLRRPAERMEAWLDEGADVYAYFNNDQQACAPLDAAWLARRLEVDAPARQR